MFDAELESFKNGIDLRAYAAEQGYQLDRKESWRGSAVMRHPNGDKIVIKRGEDGHYVYFSVRQDNDNGSIIDFVQNRQRLSLGAVRKELRPYIGMPASQLPAFAPLPKTSKDRLRVETEYAKMQDAPRHPYLENERALPASLLEAGTLRRPRPHGRAGQCRVPAFRSGRALRLRDQEQRLHRLSARAEPRASGCHRSGPTITGSCSVKARSMP